MAEAMKKALEDISANPDQTLRTVAERHGASLKHLRLHVNNRGLLFKRERNRRQESRALAYEAPAYRKLSPEEKALIEAQKVALIREQASAPAEVRARQQLTNTFERLARLWGDWIKK